MNSKKIKLVFDAYDEVLITTGLNTMGWIAKITSITPNGKEHRNDLI